MLQTLLVITYNILSTILNAIVDKQYIKKKSIFQFNTCIFFKILISVKTFRPMMPYGISSH